MKKFITNMMMNDDKYRENLFKTEEISKLHNLIQYLKENLHNSDRNVKELFDSSALLQRTIELKETQLREVNSKLQLIEENSLEHFNEVQNLKLQIEKVNEEKNQFGVTLKTTRNTLKTLGHLLRASYADVENLKLELEQLNSAKQKSESELDQVTDSESHVLTRKKELLHQHNSNLERELTEMTSKYTNLLGHQNNRQKIKHVNDLKDQNFTLKEENVKLSFTIQRNASMIEKLLKKIADMECSSPLPSRKLSKENSTSHKGIEWSPKLMGRPKLSERPLTPLKDQN